MNDNGRCSLLSLRSVCDQVQDNINKWTEPELIFDSAQRLIEIDLNTRHAQFVQSDLYITYVQKVCRYGMLFKDVAYIIIGIAYNY